MVPRPTEIQLLFAPVVPALDPSSSRLTIYSAPHMAFLVSAARSMADYLQAKGAAGVISGNYSRVGLCYIAFTREFLPVFQLDR